MASYHCFSVNSPIIATIKRTILLPNVHNKKGGVAGIKCACSRHMLHFGTFSVFGSASNVCMQAAWHKAVLLRANTTAAKAEKDDFLVKTVSLCPHNCYSIGCA